MRTHAGVHKHLYNTIFCTGGPTYEEKNYLQVIKEFLKANQVVEVLYKDAQSYSFKKLTEILTKNEYLREVEQVKQDFYRHLSDID